MATERKSILWTESKGCAILPFLLFLSLLFFTHKFDPYEGPVFSELKNVIDLNKATIERSIGTIKYLDFTSTSFKSIEKQGYGTCRVLLRGKKGKAKLFVDCEYRENHWVFFDAYLEHMEPRSENRTPLATSEQ